MSVREIQQALAAAGFDPGAIDGKMGPKTKAAITAFQRARGLKVDGIAGPQTQGALRGGGGAATSGAAAAAPVANDQQVFREKYPQFAWALDDPEVSYWLDRAVREKMGADELQGWIQKTTWWKSKTDAERAWLQKAATNPADATKAFWDYDAAVRYKKAAQDYGINIDFDGAMRQVQRVVTGKSTADELEEELRRQAKALYPQLAQQIDAGTTVEDVFGNYRNRAAQELGLDPNAIQLSDPKWSAALQFTDKAGTRRLATDDEWLALLHTDEKYGYDRTSKARGEAAEFATSIGRMFGNLS